jgi:hypothetical protein
VEGGRELPPRAEGHWNMCCLILTRILFILDIQVSTSEGVRERKKKSDLRRRGKRELTACGLSRAPACLPVYYKDKFELRSRIETNSQLARRRGINAYIKKGGGGVP